MSKPHEYKMRNKYKSILQSGDFCMVCGSTNGLDAHHVFNKFNKKRSEKYGLMIYLCRNCHSRVHNSGDGLRRDLERFGQRAWERYYGTREDFIKEFNKSYLI